MSDKQIKLGMTYKDLIDAISSDGLTITSPNDITYEGDISIKNGDTLPLPLPDIHTAVFPETINEGEVWILSKVIIKKVNLLKVDGVSVDPNSSPLLVNISDEKLWKFYFSSGSIIGSNIEYSVDLEFVFEQSLSSHRKTTRKLVQRVSALEEGGSDGATLDKIIYIDTCFSNMGGISIDDTGIRWSDEFEIKYNDIDTVSGDIYHAIPIVAGDNVTFTIESEKVVISATGGGNGLVIGETEGTAYEGSKGKKLADDFGALMQDVILPASTMLEEHATKIDEFDTRIISLEQTSEMAEGLIETVQEHASEIAGITGMVESHMESISNHENRISALEEGGGSGGGMDETALATYLSENRYVQLEEPLTSIADYLSYYYGIEQGVVLITNDNLGSEVERTLYDMLPSVAENFGYITEGTAYNIAVDVVDNSTTIAEIKDRVTALEEAGGSGSSGEGESGGSGASGGTKLYKITGNAFENMGGPITFNFQAVVSKDPTLLTVFDEIFDTFGMVSITLMPDDSGFYPIGVVKKDNSWKVYGFKEGNITTSNANFLINFEIKEL